MRPPATMPAGTRAGRAPCGHFRCTPTPAFLRGNLAICGEATLLCLPLSSPPLSLSVTECFLGVLKVRLLLFSLLSLPGVSASRKLSWAALSPLRAPSPGASALAPPRHQAGSCEVQVGARGWSSEPAWPVWVWWAGGLPAGCWAGPQGPAATFCRTHSSCGGLEAWTRRGHGCGGHSTRPDDPTPGSVVLFLALGEERFSSCF